MGLFGNLTTDGLEKQKESVGGGQRTIPTNIYSFEIKAAYVGNSQSSKAMSVNLILVDENDREYKEQVWITNGEGQNSFEVKDKDKKPTGKRSPLPGFSLINDICIIVLDKPLSELATEEKIVKIYDFDQKKEVPTAVQMITDLIGGKVDLSIREIKKFKQKKGDDNQYHDTADTTQINEIDKAFFPGMNATVREAEEALENGGSVVDGRIVDANGTDVAVYYGAWKNRWEGKLIDKTLKGNGNAGQSGKPAPTGSGSSAPETKRASLFNKG